MRFWSQPKKFLRVPEEAIDLDNIKIKLDLTYEEKPVQLLEESERGTRNKVIKFYKWCGTILLKGILRGKEKIT